jgi:hypothetical protein
MHLTELKMQPTIHLKCKAGHLPRPYQALCSKCNVDNGFIITREIPCIYKIPVPKSLYSLFLLIP